MVNSIVNDALELALGRLDLEPRDTAEIRKWLNSPALGTCFSSYNFEYDPIGHDKLDGILKKFLELDAIPPTDARTFVSLWAGAIVTASTPLDEGAGEDHVAYAREVFSAVFHGGLVHGEELSVTLWLAASLATASTKRRFRLARSAELGNERQQAEALEEALRDKAGASTVDLTHGAFVTPLGADGSGDDGKVDLPPLPRSTGRRQEAVRARSVNVFKLPLEHATFEGPTDTVPYAVFKGSLETAVKFYHIEHDRDVVLYIFRHLGPSLRSEVVLNLNESDPSSSAVWSYLDGRYGSTDTPNKASQRWESLKQRAGERVADYYSRVKAEWLLFGQVVGVQLSLSIVCAKFINGLQPHIKLPLETSCGHQLVKLTLEEARDASLYHEGRASHASAGPPDAASKKAPQQGRGHEGGQGRRRAPEARDETPGQAGSGTKDSDPGRAPPKARCSYCTAMKLRGADKHDDANCWKNPANAHLVSEWYRQRRAAKPADKASKEQAAASGSGSPPTEGTFMVMSGHEGTPGTSLRVVEASMEGPSGTTRSLELLIDTGSDVTLMSSSLAAILGAKVHPLVGSKALRAAGCYGTISVVGTATVRLSVRDVKGIPHAFSLSVEVADGLNECLTNRTILIGMKTMRKMGGRLDVVKDAFYCGVLHAHWPMKPFSGATVNTVTDGPPKRLALPTQAVVDERLKGWTFPKVTANLKPDAVRPCPRRPYLGSKREMVEARGVWISPAFAVPKVDDARDPEELTADNVEKLYRLVVDERSVNSSVQDLLPNWKTYMRPVEACISELPSRDIWYASVDVAQAFFNLEYHDDCAYLFGFSYYGAGVDGATPDTLRYAVFRRMTMGFKLSSFYWAFSVHSLLTTALPEVYRTDGLTHILDFVDDILVWSDFIDECFALKRLVIHALERVNARAPVPKQRGPARTLDYLGFSLGQGGYSLSKESMDTLREAISTVPQTLRGLRTKLGILQFCRSLWRPHNNRSDTSLAHLTAPFTTLVGKMVSSGAKRSARLKWTEELSAAWENIVKNMGDGFTPYHSPADNWLGMQFVVMSDASPVAGAACLFRLPRQAFLDQLNAGGVSAEWISSLPTSALIGVWTRKWTAHEKAYDISDRELLATCSSLLHWRNLILPFVNFFELPPADKCPAVGRVAVYMDSNSALGKLAGRLDSSRYTPTSNQAKRWLGWLSELLVFSSTDLTYHHVSGRSNSFADLLSRLLAGGRHLVPEGGGQPRVLFTPGDSTADEASPADKLAKALMSGQLLRELVLLQAADGSTRFHGDSLSTWHAHFTNGNDISRVSQEAKTLGLVSFKTDLVHVISDVTLLGEVLVPVIPAGKVAGLEQIISTNVVPNWELREWLIFAAHEADSHRAHPQVKDTICSLAWWPSIFRDIRSWISRCDYCMEQKPSKRAKLLSAPRVPRGLLDIDARGKHLAMDHGYPSPSWSPAKDPNNKAFLVMTDLSTGFTLIRCVADVGGPTTSATLFESWIALMGVPLSVTGDNFLDTPSLRSSLKACGVRFLSVPAWSPWSNGSAEARVGRIKRILPGYSLPWDAAMPHVQLAINSQQRATGHSAAELMFGTKVNTPSAAVLTAVLDPHRQATCDGLEQLALSIDTRESVRQVITDSIGLARTAVLQSHIRDCLRASASRPGKPVKDGDLVVWRRPGARPVEGHVVIVQGVNVDGGPFQYLGSMAGFSVRLRPLGSPEDKTASVSACHLEPRDAVVDRNRPTLATETTIPLSSTKIDDILLVRLPGGEDVIGKVKQDPGTQDMRIQVYDTTDGKTFLPVWMAADGDSYVAQTPADDDDYPLLRTVGSVLMKIKLTPTGKLRDTSRTALVTAGYLS